MPINCHYILVKLGPRFCSGRFQLRHESAMSRWVKEDHCRLGHKAVSVTVGRGDCRIERRLTTNTADPLIENQPYIRRQAIKCLYLIGTRDRTWLVIGVTQWL